jgi:hypothetical protein
MAWSAWYEYHYLQFIKVVCDELTRTNSARLSLKQPSGTNNDRAYMDRILQADLDVKLSELPE